MSFYFSVGSPNEKQYAKDIKEEYGFTSCFIIGVDSNIQFDNNIAIDYNGEDSILAADAAIGLAKFVLKTFYNGNEENFKRRLLEI